MRPCAGYGEYSDKKHKIPVLKELIDSRQREINK